MITLQDVTYRYRDDGQAALNNVTLTFRPGEAVCVMGRNGSGKTTLTRLLAGLRQPSRGRLRVNGESPRPGHPDSPIGLLFQNPDNQMVATLVDKEIAFALENRGIAQREMETTVAEVAERFGINHLLRRLTSELSGGEKQRVALASIMVTDPRVLILDEPDSFLDEHGRRILRAELARIHRDDPNLIEIRVTANPRTAEEYPRLIVLHGGEVLADGAPKELLSDRELVAKGGLSHTSFANQSLTVPETLRRLDESGHALAAVRVERTTLAYPSSSPVFENLSMSLQAGETVALVGRTGCGKSSLGLMLCNLIVPVSGEVQYLRPGGSRFAVADIRGRVVALLQQPERQFFLPTCAEEVAFGPRNHGRELSTDEVERFFQMVGLDPGQFAKRDPFTLSGGEKRRLAFAAVLSMAPAAVIFDEPTAGLDPEGVGRFLAISRLLKSHGVAQMIITHDGDVVRHLVDRVLYLERPDRLIELAPERLLTEPAYVGVVSAPASAV